jgi:acetyl/propionyl-CoA carboxylase alpha subunit
VFRRVLIANRGEIAVRIIHACRELGCQTAAVYSEADAQAEHVRLADFIACIGPPEASQSYLCGDKVIAAVRELGCDALHPGYGFLAENADFAQAVLDAGIAWIGPPPEAMRRMGLKVEARNIARSVNAPLVPGYEPQSIQENGPGDLPGELGSPQGQTDERLREAADQLGYPLLVKASAGGGGKGMRLVHAAGGLLEGLRAARREAQSAFGDDTVYLEKYIERPRHIEVQVLADNHGNVLTLGERECSIQRRHQKLVEETPSVAVDNEVREKLCAVAAGISREAGYVGAGTIEFILAPDGEFFFLEMNTRLQVEHPVTELVYGIDLVQWQLRVAAGESLENLAFGNCGHSIECRIVAEDPGKHFLPQTGTVELLRIPQAPGVRFDHALREGLEVSPYYDSLLGKLIVWHETRDGAIERMLSALPDLRILGVPTNIGFLQDVLAHPAFRAGELHTGLIEEHLPQWDAAEMDDVARHVAHLLLHEPGKKQQSSIGRLPNVWESIRDWSNA